MRKQRTTNHSNSLISRSLWLIAGSISCLMLAIIWQQYQSSIDAKVDFLDFNPDSPNLSQCENELTLIRANSTFSSELNNFRIYADDRIKDESKNIDKEASKCRKAFEEMLNEESYLPNLLNSNKLKVALLPGSITGGSYGIYSPKTTTIGIRYKRGTPLYLYKRYLRNEFFSYQVQTRNELNGLITEDPKKSPLLFLNRDFSINNKKLTQFEQALNNGREKVEYCKKYLLNYSADKDSSSPCETLLVLAADYKPNLYFMPGDGFQLALKYGLVTPLDENNKFHSGPNLPKHLPKGYGYKKNNEFVYCYAKDNSTLSKAIALVGDISTQFDALEDPDSPYVHLTKAEKLTEMASFISEYPKAIQKFFFRDTCNLLCEFFTQENKNNNKLNSYLSLEQNEVKKSVKENKNSFFFTEDNPKKNNQPTKQQHTSTKKPSSAKKHHFSAR